MLEHISSPVSQCVKELIQKIKQRLSDEPFSTFCDETVRDLIEEIERLEKLRTEKKQDA
jgi:hypothetical protein